MEIVGHRGAGALAPENSLQAIGQGIINRAAVIEIDVHLTKDGEVIVCHDKTINRTTNGKGKILNMALDEIKQYNIVDENGNATNLKLPTLTEVIEFIGGRAKLLIEIKDGHKEGIERKVLDIIESKMSLDSVIIQSYNDKILKEVHRQNPNIRLEKLYFFKILGLPLILDNGISVLSAKNYEHISSMNSHYRYITAAQARQIRQMGKEIRLYTIDSPCGLSAKLTPYISSIITNRPDLW